MSLEPAVGLTLPAQRVHHLKMQVIELLFHFYTLVRGQDKEVQPSSKSSHRFRL